MTGLATDDRRPTVSVIMIFYQAERFMAEAVESVRAQSFADWELVMVDDGSTDGGPTLARAYAAREPARIRCLQHPDGANRGMAASRALGMRAARGRYVAFLDADDVYLPQRLQRHLELLRGFDRPALVISADLYWRSWDPGAGADEVCTIGVPTDQVFEPPQLLRLMVDPALANNPIPSSVTFDRLDRDGLVPPPDRFTGTYEDQCLVATLLASRPARVIDECLVRYRQHAQSHMALALRDERAAAQQRDAAERAYLEWLAAHLRTLAIDDAACAAAIARRRFRLDHPRLHAALAAPRAALRATLVGLRTLARALLPTGSAAAFEASAVAWRARRRARSVRRAIDRNRSPGSP